MSSAGSFTAVPSLHPVQHVPEHRPPRRLGYGVLAENPVIIERVNGSIALLQLDPGIDEADHLPVTTGEEIRNRELQHIGLGDGDGVRRIEQAPGRALLRRGQERVEFLAAALEELGDRIERYEGRLRQISVH